MDVPPTKYAKSGKLRIAYQRFGSGPDVVYVPPLVSNVELYWEHELVRRAMEYAGRYLRVLHFDKRGIGGSDGFDRYPTLEERIADITAVLDAENLDRASLVGMSEGGLMAQLFAIHCPERVDRVVLVNSGLGTNQFFKAAERFSEFSRPEDPLWDLQEVLAFFDRLPETWGEDPGFMTSWVMPSQTDNASYVQWVGRLQRQSASPTNMERQIKSVLSLEGPTSLAELKAPTLVINVVGDRVVPPAFGRYLAAEIPNATYVEFSGTDHFCWSLHNWKDLEDAMIGHVLGRPPSSVTERSFATILFTDLVGSTATSSAAGDGAWREILNSHDRLCAQVVTEHGGRVVKSTGDGILATFGTPSSGLGAARELVRQLTCLGLSVRAGLHAGEIEVREDGDVSGMAVNLAARVEQCGEGGRVVVSSTVRDLLLGGDFRFEDRGEHTLKGVDAPWRLYALTT